MNMHHTLIHAATTYDRRQSKGKRYNVHALAQETYARNNPRPITLAKKG